MIAGMAATPRRHTGGLKNRGGRVPVGELRKGLTVVLRAPSTLLSISSKHKKAPIQV